jgi:DNA replication protein DnaC
MACDIHGNYDAINIAYGVEGGKMVTSGCPKCIQDQLDAEEKSNKSRQIRDILRNACIPDRYVSCRLSDFRFANRDQKKVVVDYIDNFGPNLSPSIVIVGRVGVGKTMLASIIAIELANKLHSVYFTSAYNVSKSIKATYDKGSVKKESDIYKDLTRYDLLIIDEVGIQFGSTADYLYLYQVINARYETMQPTVIISNLNHADLSNTIGDRCMDRLRGIALTLRGNSRRPAAINV